MTHRLDPALKALGFNSLKVHPFQRRWFQNIDLRGNLLRHYTKAASTKAPKSNKKLKAAMAAASKTDVAGAFGKRPQKARVVYIGHVPHGFYEDQMKSYFSQFGEVTRLRLSRSKKTGKSKHFAFVEFKHSARAEEEVQVDTHTHISSTPRVESARVSQLLESTVHPIRKP